MHVDSCRRAVPHRLEGDASSPVLLKMGCTAIEVPLEEVQRHMKRVYSRALQSTLDASHLFTSDGWVHMITSDGWAHSSRHGKGGVLAPCAGGSLQPSAADGSACMLAWP